MSLLGTCPTGMRATSFIDSVSMAETEAEGTWGSSGKKYAPTQANAHIIAPAGGRTENSGLHESTPACGRMPAQQGGIHESH